MHECSCENCSKSRHLTRICKAAKLRAERVHLPAGTHLRKVKMASISAISLIHLTLATYKLVSKIKRYKSFNKRMQKLDIEFSLLEVSLDVTLSSFDSLVGVVSADKRHEQALEQLVAAAKTLEFSLYSCKETLETISRSQTSGKKLQKLLGPSSRQVDVLEAHVKASMDRLSFLGTTVGTLYHQVHLSMALFIRFLLEHQFQRHSQHPQLKFDRSGRSGKIKAAAAAAGVRLY